MVKPVNDPGLAEGKGGGAGGGGSGADSRAGEGSANGGSSGGKRPLPGRVSAADAARDRERQGAAKKKKEAGPKLPPGPTTIEVMIFFIF